MITIKYTAKQRGKVYAAWELPSYIDDTKQVWNAVGSEEQYNVTLRPDGTIAVEYVFWHEQNEEWDSFAIDNASVTEDIVLYRLGDSK